MRLHWHAKPGVIVALAAGLLFVGVCFGWIIGRQSASKNWLETYAELNEKEHKERSSRMERLRARASQGEAQAQFELGAAWAVETDLPNHSIEALKWYRMAAEQGFAQAQYALGNMYNSGWPMPKHDAEAEKWYRMAAEQGFAQAQYALGRIYESKGEARNGDFAFLLNSNEYKDSDFMEAVKWYRMAAEQSHAEAQCCLASMYRYGRGVPKNKVLAYAWANLAGTGGELCTSSIEDGMTPGEIAEAQRLSAPGLPALRDRRK